tara:strand:+ start:1383 stop:2846 length:1464 start_codon:yes stop_codon:yes gene_type:complete
MFFSVIKKLLPAVLYFIPYLYAQAFNGMTLYSPISNGATDFTTYLIDNQGTIVNSWTHTRGVASMPYLQRDSTLIYPYRVENPSMNIGGSGGGISKYSWEGDLVWNYEIANETYQHHHDIEPLPNGNILVIVYEKKSAQEAYAMGRLIIENPLNQMWAEAILEIEPLGSNDANIVWEWHIWDHMVQDVDPSLPNFGSISEHPELQDINYGSAGAGPPTSRPGGADGDWKHFNAIAYNDELDQIAVSSRNHDEIYIIDHSTTTQEAAGHYGGNSDMGGDYLYRWGNPNAYGRGNNDADHILKDPHGVNWVPSGFPGEGNLLIFNNNHTNLSAVIEIITPINESGRYDIEDGIAFGPVVPYWIYTGDFHTEMQGGAFRLPNGNTLITDCDDGYIFEVTSDHNIVWDHSDIDEQTFIARAQKYSFSYLDLNHFLLGDINYNGHVDIIDLIMLSDMILGYGYLPNPPSDYNSDGNTNDDDLTLLIQFLTMN